MMADDLDLFKKGEDETTPNVCRREIAGHYFCNENHVCFVCFQPFVADGITNCEKCGWRACPQCGGCGCRLTQEEYLVLEGLAKRYCYLTYQQEPERIETLAGATFIVRYHQTEEEPEIPAGEEIPLRYRMWWAYRNAETGIQQVMVAMALTFLTCSRTEALVLAGLTDKQGNPLPIQPKLR